MVASKRQSSRRHFLISGLAESLRVSRGLLPRTTSTSIVKANSGGQLPSSMVCNPLILSASEALAGFSRPSRQHRVNSTLYFSRTLITPALGYHGLSQQTSLSQVAQILSLINQSAIARPPLPTSTGLPFPWRLLLSAVP